MSGVDPNMKTRAKPAPAKTARGHKARRVPGPPREGLRGGMSSDPDVIAGNRDRDAIPHTGREGFGDGQDLSHSKKR
jgi:hypothetical protein